jgi:hypothetical protein
MNKVPLFAAGFLATAFVLSGVGAVASIGIFATPVVEFLAGLAGGAAAAVTLGRSS